MNLKKILLKFAFRFLVVNVVFFLAKLTVEHAAGEQHDFASSTMVFYYVTTFILFMVTWEVNDWLLRKQKVVGPLDFKSSIRILLLTLAVLLPLSAIIYYLAFFPFIDVLGIKCTDPEKEFVKDFFRADLIGLTVTVLNILYHAMNQRDEMKRQMEDLKKEVVATKYASLKNQISPHFLFNSLNTLTSLMYEDRDLASDYVTRLAKSYRYILDNREEDLVSLEKEMQFLDSFIFMMNVRHEHAIEIKTKISNEANQLLIPTLSLQMLVDNALKHNFYSKEKPMLINIYTVGINSVVVENTYQKRTLEEESTQLGLKNIQKRYSFYSNQNIMVENNEHLFKVSIPLLAKNVKGASVISVSK